MEKRNKKRDAHLKESLWKKYSNYPFLKILPIHEKDKYVVAFNGSF